MTGREDPVMVACREIEKYLAWLEDLTGEPAPQADGPVVMRARPSVICEPYGQAGRVLMTILEGIRRLEASLKRETAGRLGTRRPLSAEHTGAVLEALPKLAAGLTKDEAERAEVILSGWISESRSVHGIDENPRWRHLPRQGSGDGALPPQCPCCRLYYLLYDPDTRRIVCSVPGCEDANGDSPVASVTTDASGRPMLEWNDGKRQVAPDLGT